MEMHINAASPNNGAEGLALLSVIPVDGMLVNPNVSKTSREYIRGRAEVATGTVVRGWDQPQSSAAPSKVSSTYDQDFPRYNQDLPSGALQSPKLIKFVIGCC